MPQLETEDTKDTAELRREHDRGALRLLAHGDNRWDEDEYSPDEEARMIELYAGTLASIEEGEIVKSKVLEIRDNMVILDIGFKSEGAVPLEEFKDHPDLKPGDEVLATAILDRLLHHCDVVAINGPSYRLKNRLTALENVA